MGAATAMNTTANMISEAIAIGPLVTARNSPLHRPSVRSWAVTGSTLWVIDLSYGLPPTGDEATIAWRRYEPRCPSVRYSWIEDRVQKIDDEIDDDIDQRENQHEPL